MSDSSYFGMYQGIVTKIDDPEKRGRIKVTIPTVTGETESAWCDPVVPIAYDGGGDFCVPSLREAVWVMFIEGDYNRPVYLGGWWSKDKTPLKNNYTGIEDLRIISYKDCLISMRNGKIVIAVGSSNNEIEIADGSINIKGNLTVSGSISANSVSAGGVSLSNHVHSLTFGAEGEEGTTNAPS